MNNNSSKTDLFFPIEIKTDLLKPFLSEKQMKAHYTGHYLKYCNNFNKFLQDNCELKDIFNNFKNNRTELLLQIVKKYTPDNTIYQNVAQIYNHELFFNSLINTNKSISMLCELKDKLFSSNALFEDFYMKFMVMNITTI
jgi:superoxide dismutase